MKRLLIMLILVPIISFGEIIPTKGNKDSRIRTVNYDAMDIVKIQCFPGVQTHIQLDQDEKIETPIIADPNAWAPTVSGNSIFLTPTDPDHPDTNLHIKTSKGRTYTFLLKIAPHDRKDPKAQESADIFYTVYFKYPTEEQKKKDEIAKAEAEKQAEEKAKEVIAERFEEVKERILNDNYLVRGNYEVIPDFVTDDGKFVTLTFKYNKDFPAIYELTEPPPIKKLTSENMHEVDFAVDDNKIVISKLVKHMLIVSGNGENAKVAEIITNSPVIGIENESGTVDSSVVREVKDAD